MINVQKAGGFAKLVGGSAKTIDAGERFVPALPLCVNVHGGRFYLSRDPVLLISTAGSNVVGMGFVWALSHGRMRMRVLHV